MLLRGDILEIKKILNNNAVLVAEAGKDYIWIGAGLGFQKKVGQLAEKDKIEKVFVLVEEKATERFITMLEDIPVEFVSLADDIIKFAKERTTPKISETIYISLTDHLYNLYKLHKEGIKITNRLSWEIKRFYPKEFAVGVHALALIKEQLGLEPAEDEAGNIAMHVINAQLNEDFTKTEDVQAISKKIREILAIIRMHNKMEINEETLAFDRFVTHLRFFFKRLENLERNNKTNPLLEHFVEKYVQAYETMKLIEKYLNVALNDDEQLYLALHIQKLIDHE